MMRMNFSRWTAMAVFSGWLLAGCAVTVGAKFDSAAVAQIKPESTTQEQVRQMFGPPASEGLKDGKPLWTYIHARVPLLGGTAKGTVVTIEFNRDGVVQSYTYIPY